jgi:hypothetical protein
MFLSLLACSQRVTLSPSSGGSVVLAVRAVLVKSPADTISVLQADLCVMTWLLGYVDPLDPNFVAAVLTIAFNPLFWNVVSTFAPNTIWLVNLAQPKFTAASHLDGWTSGLTALPCSPHVLLSLSLLASLGGHPMKAHYRKFLALGVPAIVGHSRWMWADVRVFQGGRDWPCWLHKSLQQTTVQYRGFHRHLGPSHS